MVPVKSTWPDSGCPPISAPSFAARSTLMCAPVVRSASVVIRRLGSITSKSISSGEWMVVTVRQTPSTDTLAPISMSSVNRSGNSMLKVLSSP